MVPTPLRPFLDVIRARADERGTAIWAVGGWVRDACLGVRVRDIDVATDGDPSALLVGLAGIEGQPGVRVRHEPRFGTASVEAGEQRIDLAALRTEGYARPGALPRVRLGATVEADLGRRDFSVHAVAVGLVGLRSGEVVDPYGGLADLAARRLRVLHGHSFVEDATRLWRGARYAARLGLRPDPTTMRLIEKGGRWLAPISGRRLWAEFERTADERRVLGALRLLDGWGVLEATSSGFGLTATSARALRGHPGPMPPALLFAVLAAPLDVQVRAALAGRLSAPREAVRAAEDAARLLGATSDDVDTLEAVAGTGPLGRRAALWLAPDRQRARQRALRRWERTRPHLEAAELMTMGVRGPEIGQLLRRLRRERYLGTLTGVADGRRLVRDALAGERRDV